MTDSTGDGMVGANYYNRGHVTFRRSYLGYALSFIALILGVLIGLVVIGAMLNINVAQNVLEYVIAGKR